MMRVAVTLLAALLLAGSSAVLAEGPAAPNAAADAACHCKVCDPSVCCKVPTGFAPLDQKCTSSCREEHWAAGDGGKCEPRADCCR